MPYGSSKWQKQDGRALTAGKSKSKRTKAAKLSKSDSAPRAKKSSTPKAKRPCKYGPRDADGYCPKKPKAPKKPKKGKGKSAKAVPLYDPETGKIAARVKRGTEEFDAYLADGFLERKPRMLWRYNPETGRRVQVPETSGAADEWPTRKPAKTVAGLFSQGAKLGAGAGAGYIGSQVARRVERKVTSAVGKALGKGAQAGLKVLDTYTKVPPGTAAKVIITGAIIGWNLGKAINYTMAHLDDRLDAALRNYVNARKEAERRLGRPLTKSELRTMYQAYQETVVRLKANEPDTFLRPGAG